MRRVQDIQSGVFSGFVLLRTVAALLGHCKVQREGLFAVAHTSLLSQLPFYVPKLGFIDRDVVRSEICALSQTHTTFRRIPPSLVLT